MSRSRLSKFFNGLFCLTCKPSIQTPCVWCAPRYLLAEFNIQLLLPTIFIYLFSLNALADDLQLSLVLNQGIVGTSDNGFYGDSDDGFSTDFTELSINGNYRISPKVRIAGQVLYLHAGEVNDGVELDYLFLDSQFYSNEHFNLGINLGRFKNPIGHYNETRDIAFTRPGIFLAQGIYPDSLRDLFISSDGILVYGNLFQPQGEWHFEIAYGKPRVEKFGKFLPKNTDISRGRATLGRLIYEHNAGQWKLGLSYANQTANVKASDLSGFDLPVAVNGPVNGEQISKQIQLTAQYNFSRWTFTAEYVYTDADITGKDITIISPLPPFAPLTLDFSIGSQTESFYFQAENRIDRYWTAIARWNVLNPNKNNKNTEIGNASFGYIDSKRTSDLTLGIRRKLKKNMMLNAEYHYVKGVAWLAVEDNANSSLKSPWQLWALTFSYRL
ncbi:MAG: hypothetical protein KUG79_03660 [Pseudomonadales bacterium]|nr:hypothetical protein [Pseudomonadales bacterium]